MKEELEVSWILPFYNSSRGYLCRYSSSCWKLGAICETCV